MNEVKSNQYESINEQRFFLRFLPFVFVFDDKWRGIAGVSDSKQNAFQPFTHFEVCTKDSKRCNIAVPGAAMDFSQRAEEMHAKLRKSSSGKRANMIFLCEKRYTGYMKDIRTIEMRSRLKQIGGVPLYRSAPSIGH